LKKEQLGFLGKLNQMTLDETEDGWEWKKGLEAQADIKKHVGMSNKCY
jgi:hypothetical protein